MHNHVNARIYDQVLLMPRLYNSSLDQKYTDSMAKGRSNGAYRYGDVAANKSGPGLLESVTPVPRLATRLTLPGPVERHHCLVQMAACLLLASLNQMSKQMTRPFRCSNDVL